MKMSALWLMLLLPLGASPVVRTTASPVTEAVACVVRQGSVLVSFGATKRPTYFGVLTPNDHFIYLRYPPRGIDVLGEQYLEDPIELDVSGLTGVRILDDELLPARVFPGPGNYQLHFQDANTALGIDLHQAQCTVTVGRTTAGLRRSDVQQCTRSRRLSSVGHEGTRAGCFTGTCGYWDRIARGGIAYRRDAGT